MEHEQKLEEFRKQNDLKKEMYGQDKLIDELGQLTSVPASQRKASVLQSTAELASDINEKFQSNSTPTNLARMIDESAKGSRSNEHKKEAIVIGDMSLDSDD